MSPVVTSGDRPASGGDTSGVPGADAAGDASRSGSGDRAEEGPREEELEVESIAVGGDGVARQESGRVVFLPRTAPGDRVRARLTEERGSWARARAVDVLEPSPDRREPPCPLYDRCGGCQLQHMGYGAQLEAKRRAVADSLERIGGRAVEVPPVVAAERRLGYRNRVTFTLRRGRERSGVEAGYHRWDEPERLVDVDECPLAEPAVDRAWRRLRGAWGPGAERLPAGAELRITIRGSARGRVILLVEEEVPAVEGGADGGGSGRGGAGDAPDEGRAGEAAPEGAPDAVRDALGDDLAGYFWRPAGGPRRLLAGEPRMEERWLGLDLRLGPESFLQVNRSMTRRMEAWLDGAIEERADGPGGRRVLDLYAGVGARAIRWARAGADVAACEIDDDAVRDGREAAARAGTDVAFRVAPVEDALADLLPANLVVVNPPRAGLARPVTDILADASPGALAYVSCDPATLARDLDRLGERWEVASLRAFDAFPQTAHVETVAWLEPR